MPARHLEPTSRQILFRNRFDLQVDPPRKYFSSPGARVTEILCGAGSGPAIGPAEAAAAKVEIGRRLLASADAERAAPVVARQGPRRAVALVALIGLPVLALAVYLPLGSPTRDDEPLAARKQAPMLSQPLEALVAKVEAHLEKNPTDGRGWTVLAPVLEVYQPDAGFYLWARVPGGDDAAFARELFRQTHVTVLPGQFLAREAHGAQPGRGFVRMALVAGEDACTDAASRIAAFCRSAF